MLANLKIICQFHAHPLHQNSVDIFWAEIYRVRLLLGPNLDHEYQITAHPYGVDVLSPPPYCTRVSKDTGSSSCERKMLRPSVYISRRRHIVCVSPMIQEVVLVNERCLGHQYIFSNHKTHTTYHMLYIVMSIQDVSIYPLCLAI
jgi:hypothetical protein